MKSVNKIILKDSVLIFTIGSKCALQIKKTEYYILLILSGL